MVMSSAPATSTEHANDQCRCARHAFALANAALHKPNIFAGSCVKSCHLPQLLALPTQLHVVGTAGQSLVAAETEALLLPPPPLLLVSCVSAVPSARLSKRQQLWLSLREHSLLMQHVTLALPLPLLLLLPLHVPLLPNVLLLLLLLLLLLSSALRSCGPQRRTQRTCSSSSGSRTKAEFGSQQGGKMCVRSPASAQHQHCTMWCLEHVAAGAFTTAQYHA
jgi:hypothetical protein